MFFPHFYLALQLGLTHEFRWPPIVVRTIASKTHGDFIQWLFTLGHFWINKRFFGGCLHVSTLLFSNTFFNEKELLTRRYQSLFFQLLGKLENALYCALLIHLVGLDKRGSNFRNLQFFTKPIPD